MAIQSDGKIVVAGFSYNDANHDFALARYNTNGTLNTTFSKDGKLTTDFGSSSIAIQSDGKIVVAGSAIVRYNPDGSLNGATA